MDELCGQDSLGAQLRDNGRNYKSIIISKELPGERGEGEKWIKAEKNIENKAY